MKLHWSNHFLSSQQVSLHYAPSTCGFGTLGGGVDTIIVAVYVWVYVSIFVYTWLWRKENELHSNHRTSCENPLICSTLELGGCPLTLLQGLSYINKPASRDDFWVMCHMPILPELALMDCTDDRPWINLSNSYINTTLLQWYSMILWRHFYQRHQFTSSSHQSMFMPHRHTDRQRQASYIWSFVLFQVY